MACSGGLRRLVAGPCLPCLRGTLTERLNYRPDEPVIEFGDWEPQHNPRSGDLGDASPGRETVR
jgi:hypothetical protein